MKTLAISLEKNFQKALENAVLLLKKGSVIVIPTETSYGLAAKASNKNAVKKIAEIKKQPPEKPVSIIVPSIEIAKKYGHIDVTAKRFVEKFMPGPLTLVVPAKKKARHLGGKTIAFRVSSNKFAKALCQQLGDAVTATSANIHGEVEIYSAKKAFSVFSGKVSLVVDAGALPKRKPSTIYDVQKRIILRGGKIKEKEIRKALAAW